MVRIYFAFALLASIFLFAGCAGSPGSPTLPPSEPSPLQATTDTPSPETYGPTTGLWGLWDITVDTSTETVEILPLRGIEFTCNMVKFLQPPAGLLNGISVSITDLSEFMSDGRMKLDVTFAHPFPGLDQFTGFDVYGIFIHQGGRNFQHGTNTIKISDGYESAILENADGYTIWMSPELFPGDGTFFTFMPGALGTPGFPPDNAADANGFKYFADGLASDENVGGFFHDFSNEDMRGKFSAGSQNTREYVIRWPLNPAPVVTFQYAVTANWDLADKANFGDPDVLDIPYDFPITANAKEPVHIGVTDKSTTWYVDDIERGGDIILDLEIFTWHDLAGIGDIHLSSSTSIIPGGTQVFDPLTLAWSPGALNSSVTTVEIIDVLPTSTVGQDILIAVDAAPPVTYDQGFGSSAPDIPLAAYFLHGLYVKDAPPSGDLDASATATIEPYFDGFGPAGTVDDPIPTEWWLTLDASASAGSISEYLWEMNGDDLYDDASGMIVSAGFPDPGTHVIKLKIIDGFGGEAIFELPGSYEVVEGTYVWWGYPGDFSDGSRGSPWITIIEAIEAVEENAYILVRGDDGLGGQCDYQENLTLMDDHQGSRIQGYYGDYDVDVPPLQTGFVRIEGDNCIYDGFEVSGPSYSTYYPYGHRSKLGTDQADNTLFRHLYIHDLNADCKAILCWFGGSLLVQNVLEIELGAMNQKNQAHEDDVDPGPQLDFLNSTLDRLGDTGSPDVGLYVSSGGGADFEPSLRNCIFTDIAGGTDTVYFRRQGPFSAWSYYTCTSDTIAPPDGGTYYQGIDEGDGNTTLDPLYVDPFTDHHLQAGSPCEDTGDPEIFDHDGSASDMGCYGGPYGDWDFED